MENGHRTQYPLLTENLWPTFANKLLWCWFHLFNENFFHMMYVIRNYLQPMWATPYTEATGKTAVMVLFSLFFIMMFAHPLFLLPLTLQSVLWIWAHIHKKPYWKFAKGLQILLKTLRINFTMCFAVLLHPFANSSVSFLRNFYFSDINWQPFSVKSLVSKDFVELCQSFLFN